MSHHLQSVRAAARIKHPSDSGLRGYVFADALPAGVTIASVAAPAVTGKHSTTGVVESVPTLTVTSQAVNAAPFTDDDGNTVGVGLAVQATESGGTKDYNYDVQFIVTLSNGESLGGVFPVYVRA